MITLTIVDHTGADIISFTANGEDPILDQAEKQMMESKIEKKVEIPYQCRAGSCLSCGANVLEGMSHIEEELGGDKFIDTDEGEILTCISGFKKESIDSEEKFEVRISLFEPV